MPGMRAVSQVVTELQVIVASRPTLVAQRKT